MVQREYSDPEEKERTQEFRKSEEEETLLEALNAYLVPFERELLGKEDSPRFPVTFVVGIPRCGSTLFIQLAVNNYELGYPSNLMARFFKVPAVGAWIQRLLIDSMQIKRTLYESSFGVTIFPEEPHEFGYFWTSFFKPGLTHWFEPDRLKQVDKGGLLKKLGAMEAILGRPLIFKSLNLDFLVEYLGKVLCRPLFVYVKRDPYFAAQSVYLARIRRYGTAEAWWSLRPKQYSLLKEMDPYRQVAGQIWATRTELERQLGTIPEAQKLELDYKAICEDPGIELHKYAAKMEALGCPITKHSEPPSNLTCRNKVRLSPREARELRKALGEMENSMNW